MELDSLYQEVILDHYKHPQHKGLSPTFTAQVSHVNTSCGDEIILNIILEDGVISSLTWEGQGCSISQASVSIASVLLVYKSFADADSILNEFTELMQSKGTKEGNPDALEDAVALAGVSKFPARIKCALLGWMAFKDAAVRINTTTGGE